MSTEPDPIQELPRLFYETGRAFQKWMDVLSEMSGTSPARARLLGLLHCQGPQTLCVLAEELDVTPRNVTALVDGLESDKLAERTSHPVDRRATVVRLTKAGENWAHEHLVRLAERYAEAFSELPRGDRVELARLLRSVRDTVQKLSGAPGDDCGKGP